MKARDNRTNRTTVVFENKKSWEVLQTIWNSQTLRATKSVRNGVSSGLYLRATAYLDAP